MATAITSKTHYLVKVNYGLSKSWEKRFDKNEPEAIDLLNSNVKTYHEKVAKFFEFVTKENHLTWSEVHLLHYSDAILEKIYLSSNVCIFISKQKSI